MSSRLYHNRSDGPEYAYPLMGKAKGLKLILPFLRLLVLRERILPEDILVDYLNKHILKKDLFMESARDFGTPQYLYDQPNLVRRVQEFHEAFSKNIPNYRTYYAIKSNCFSLILCDIVKSGMGLDASSGRELNMALQTGCKKILFSGPGKTDEEIRIALENSDRVILLMDNFNEFSRLSNLIKRRKPIDDLDVGIRICSDMSGLWGKFGIPLKDLAVLMDKTTRTKGLKLRGIQFHSSWNLDPSRQVSMIRDIGSYLIKTLPVHILENLKFMDIGGGFWPEQGEWLNPRNLPLGRMAEILGREIPLKTAHYYRPAKTIEEFARNIGDVFLSQPKPICDLELYMEPGRWISTPAMHILLKVTDIKGSNAVITDGGINLLGWERPLNEFIPVLNLTRFTTSEHPLKIYGSLCAPEDQWGDSIFGTNTSPGDILLIPDQGAYTYSLRQAFIKPISQVVWYNGNSLEQVERENWRK